MISLELTSISKTYNGRHVLRDVCCAAASGQVLGILGANGSGKSTLIKLVAGVVRADAGQISCVLDGTNLDASKRRSSCGLVGPYLSLYEEFTPREHLHLHAKLHGTTCSDAHVTQTLATVQIEHRADDRISTFSSGMKQRVALACASVLAPPLLLLDEPGSTLDEAGRAICETIIREQQQRGGITLLATNDERELHLCTHTFRIPS